jgi:hypothetical protein
VRSVATLRPVSTRDRSITLALVVAAALAWLAVAVILTTLSPLEEAAIQLLGALALGTAVALTLWPLLWAARRGVPGSLVTAGRRSGLAGLVVSILVVLRALDVVALPVVLFLIIGAVLVELAFSLRH